MKNLLLLGFLVACWILFNSSTQPVEDWIAPAYADTIKNPFMYNEKSIVEGKKIYESMCWTCHGLNGKGDGPASKDLHPAPADHTSGKIQRQSDGAIFWKLSKGRGLMIPFEQSLSKQQRWKLVCYIRELGKQYGAR
jgi:mono/diheme cytochrome c family protein